MQKIKAILLLFILGIIVFPWKLVCITHPLDHSHEQHEPGKLSPCELHKKYAGKETCFLPSMHCKHVSPDTENYQISEKFQVKPAYQTLVMAPVLLEFIKVDHPERPFLFPPEPKCRSASIITVYSLRAPPSC